MNEYLSKEFIEKILDAHLEDSRGAENYAYNIIKRELMAAPGSNVVEARHGRWIVCTNNSEQVYCSECSLIVEDIAECFSYCPNCGAHMR